MIGLLGMALIPGALGAPVSWAGVRCQPMLGVGGSSVSSQSRGPSQNKAYKSPVASANLLFGCKLPSSALHFPAPCWGGWACEGVGSGLLSASMSVICLMLCPCLDSGSV